jgi:nicotinamide riboside kinase
MNHPIRLVLTGPESTGKSALTSWLATTLGAPSADEYARIHLERRGATYDYPMLLELSRLHVAHQAACVPPGAPVGILDTDLLNYQVWCEVVYGKCHPEILSAIERESHHRYLLCYPDLPWEPDPLREHPDARDMLFDRHRDAIEQRGRPYRIVRGTGPAREQAALAAARALLD